MGKASKGGTEHISIKSDRMRQETGEAHNTISQEIRLVSINREMNQEQEDRLEIQRQRERIQSFMAGGIKNHGGIDEIQ